MPAFMENTGSTARDFQMLERNLLSHVKLAMLLSLLSSSILLRTRLSGGSSTSSGDPSKIQLPIASLEFAAALCTIFAGMYQYFRTWKDYQTLRGFLTATNPPRLVCQPALAPSPCTVMVSVHAPSYIPPLTFEPFVLGDGSKSLTTTLSIPSAADDIPCAYSRLRGPRIRRKHWNSPPHLQQLPAPFDADPPAEPQRPPLKATSGFALGDSPPLQVSGVTSDDVRTQSEADGAPQWVPPRPRDRAAEDLAVLRITGRLASERRRGGRAQNHVAPSDEEFPATVTGAEFPSIIKRSDSGAGKWKIPWVEEAEGSEELRTDDNIRENTGPLSLNGMEIDESCYTYDPHDAPEFLVGTSTSVMLQATPGFHSRHHPRKRPVRKPRNRFHRPTALVLAPGSQLDHQASEGFTEPTGASTTTAPTPSTVHSLPPPAFDLGSLELLVRAGPARPHLVPIANAAMDALKILS
ncbi:hypothetical protein IEO21_07913 [Rhodonia placenta]|uniref:DUF202 domain-containing protein n=1 Tax=Rhodonia placenta TaxID=104341 RepID=A0A8H7TZ84_9APHY|nr:hypothetical protein IEO21_07913 [Postia placenta]